MIAVFSSDLISDKWTTAFPKKKNFKNEKWEQLLWLVLHTWCFEYPNIFLFNSLTIIIFIRTEFLCVLHWITGLLFLEKNKILTNLPIILPFIREWEATPKTRSGKNVTQILFNFFKSFCILNSMFTYISQ